MGKTQKNEHLGLVDEKMLILWYVCFQFHISLLNFRMKFANFGLLWRKLTLNQKKQNWDDKREQIGTLDLRGTGELSVFKTSRENNYEKKEKLTEGGGDL